MAIKKLHQSQGKTSLGGVEMLQLWKIHSWLVRVEVTLGTTVQSSFGTTEIVDVERGFAMSTRIITIHGDDWYSKAKSPEHGQYEVMGEVAAKLAQDTEMVLVAVYGGDVPGDWDSK